MNGSARQNGRFSGINIRYIANRLSELRPEEELAAENIELQGRKVDEYENRIASLEYQLELLKRQLGGEIVLPTEVTMPKPIVEMANVVLYNPLGQVLRMEAEAAGLVSGKTLAKIQSEVPIIDLQPNVLVTSSQEELLFIFDSGRTVAMPVTKLVNDPDNLDWNRFHPGATHLMSWPHPTHC
jgi:hypothetical protein